MAYKLSKFGKVTGSLEPGETFVAGAFAMAPGTMKRQMAGALGGAIGAAIASSGSGASGSFELPRRFVMGLTERRILLFKPDALWAKPKELIGAIPLGDVVSAGFTSGGAMSNKAAIALRNGQVLEVECAKGPARKWLEELLAAVEQRRAAA